MCWCYWFRDEDPPGCVGATGSHNKMVLDYSWLLYLSTVELVLDKSSGVTLGVLIAAYIPVHWNQGLVWGQNQCSSSVLVVDLM